MNSRQATILIGLATDAKNLKVMNGWYVNPEQGDSTVQEDEGAIAALEALQEKLEHEEGEARMKTAERLIGGFGILVREKPFGKLCGARASMLATDFWGLIQDMNLEEAEKKLGELEEELAVVKNVSAGG